MKNKQQRKMVWENMEQKCYCAVCDARARNNNMTQEYFVWQSQSCRCAELICMCMFQKLYTLSDVNYIIFTRSHSVVECECMKTALEIHTHTQPATSTQSYYSGLGYKRFNGNDITRALFCHQSISSSEVK